MRDITMNSKVIREQLGKNITELEVHQAKLKEELKQVEDEYNFLTAMAKAYDEELDKPAPGSVIRIDASQIKYPAPGKEGF